ncbi:MAG TPA: nucleotidyltransferase family protein, partial [Solirubrobacteraceae bacterium]|nr:nucleotidyltransferase family protein [Solirubrobacteraceae bacterium]
MRRSPIEELTLLSAGTVAHRAAARTRARGLLAAIDRTQLAESLASMRLLATLGPRIVELAGASGEEQFEHSVADALATGRRHGALLALIAQKTIGMLGEAGIRASPLKGPLLAEALYGDPARRSSSDVDLLVAPAQLAQAVAVVRELGYAPPRDEVDESGLPLLHFALIHERGELPPIELHWRVHWYETRFAHERLLAPRGSHERWRPEPIDELAALLLFYARDGFLGLRHASDIGAWWDAFGGGVQRGAIDALIADHPRLEHAVRASLAVAERTVGLPVRELTRGHDHIRTRARVAVRLSDPCPSSGAAQQYAQMGLVDGLLAPPGELRAFVTRQLAPRR